MLKKQLCDPGHDFDQFDCTVVDLSSFAFSEERSCAKLSSSSKLLVSNSNNSNKSTETMVCDVGKKNSSDSGIKVKYTPLEMQFLELKQEYSDTILLIECGYKYRMFGEDAQIASAELGLACYMNHNFLSASFPCHRLQVHVRRLVVKGYKVGVVKQTESSALKAAGNNKNTLFNRNLHALYTQSTFIEGDLINSETDEAHISAGSLMCIKECTGKSSVISLVAVNVSCGDVFYASFKDSPYRSDLESFFFLLNPSEFLLPVTPLSNATENLIKNFLEMKSRIGRKVRVERTEDEKFDFTTALHKISEFWNEPKVQDLPEQSMLEVLGLPPPVICCLAPVISYLTEFHLDILLKNFRQFKQLSSSSAYMAISPSSIHSLELTENLSDLQEYGSLLWTVNFAHTKSGKKMLKSWILKPLKNIMDINSRQDSVEEILHSKSSAWNMIEKMLSKLPDLETLLSAAFYHKCTCLQFLSLVTSLSEVKKCFVAVSERMVVEIRDSNLKNIFQEAVTLLKDIEIFKETIDDTAAREDDKTQIFHDVTKYPKIWNCKKQIEFVEEKLQSLRIDIARTLHLDVFHYTSVMGQNFLIEVKNSHLSLVPSEWIKINSTKQVSRFRSPEVNLLCTELQQWSEKLIIICDEAWNAFLDEFSENFYQFKRVILHLSTLDCLLSFAKVAKQNGYCRPLLASSSECTVDIVHGRNPIVSKLASKNCIYISNSTNLNSCKRCMVITGPNMGGKSSYIRQVAHIAILAQAGSYVPAEYASLPVFDGIFTRMGGEDDLCCMQSTFMREMQETSFILSSASSDSLVILDELGRGTSSHDGAAVAYATLHHLIHEVKCITLFVTHYADVAKDLQEKYPDNVTTAYMSFLIGNEAGDVTCSSGDVTFLFCLKEGIASKSYGINVARLAGIPEKILTKAKQKSKEIEKQKTKL